MKAILHTELRCGECGSMLQYHKDEFVRCVQLKCKERHVEYKAPEIQLTPVIAAKEEKPKRGRPAAVKD